MMSQYSPKVVLKTGFQQIGQSVAGKISIQMLENVMSPKQINSSIKVGAKAVRMVKGRQTMAEVVRRLKITWETVNN